VELLVFIERGRVEWRVIPPARAGRPKRAIAMCKVDLA
jgi:hypothetical protein